MIEHLIVSAIVLAPAMLAARVLPHDLLAQHALVGELDGSTMRMRRK